MVASPRSKSMEARPCPECGELSERMPPSKIQGHFNVASKGIGPQNTGAQGFDANVDRVIGQDAAQGHEIIQRRQREKIDFIHRNNLDPRRVSRLPDGTYGENSVEEQGFADRAHQIDAKAMAEARRIFEAKKAKAAPNQ